MVKKISHIILLIQFFIPLAYGQISSQILDARDSTIYKTIIIDSIEWMTENLNFKTNGSYKFLENCDSCGLLYTYEAAKNACPSDFRLPSQIEWNNLFKRLEGVEVVTDWGGIFYYGIKSTLNNPQFINLKYCGFFRQNPFSEKEEKVDLV